MRSTTQRTFGVFVMVAGAVALVGTRAEAARPAQVDNQVMIQFRPGVEASASANAVLKSALPEAALQDLHTSSSGGAVALVTAPAGKVQELISRLRANPAVAVAEPNYYAYAPTPIRSGPAHASAAPRVKTGFDSSGRPTFRTIAGVSAIGPTTYPAEDPTLDQWGWWYTDTNVIWNNGVRCPLIAVLDTGVDLAHPDLKGRCLAGFDAVRRLRVTDDNGHGTHVAGIIAALTGNRVGISGVSNGQILPIKVLNFAGQGTYYDIIAGLNFAAANPYVKVINMSLGGADESALLRQAIYDAVYTRGKLIVAAAGNDDSNTPQYPAAYSVGSWDVTDPILGPVTVSFEDRVLAVGALGISVTPSGGGGDVFVEYCKAPYSNYGAWVNIAAPGTAITSTTPYRKDYYNLLYGDSPDGYNTYSGTSMAAPFVSAAAARAWTTDKTMTNVDLARRLTGNGSPAFPVVMGDVDVDGDLAPDLTCWDPDYAQAGGASGRTLDLADLDVSVAMQRSGVWGYAQDAYNGLALSGAVALAVNTETMRGAGKSAPIGQGGPVDQDYYEILNIPWSNTAIYDIKINKTGYTYGPQPVDSVLVDGSSVWVQARQIAVPPRSNNSVFVTNWGTGSSSYLELDQHVLFPVGTDGLCDVGFTPGISDPAYWCGVGSLFASPWTRWLHDSYDSLLTFDTTAIRPPLYLTTTQPYQVFVVDGNQGDDIRDPVAGMPITRLWRLGVVRAQVEYGAGTTVQGDCTFNGGSAVCETWHVGDLASNLVFTPVNYHGDGTTSAIIPFGGASAATSSSASSSASSSSSSVSSWPTTTASTSTTSSTSSGTVATVVPASPPAAVPSVAVDEAVSDPAPAPVVRAPVHVVPTVTHIVPSQPLITTPDGTGGQPSFVPFLPPAPVALLSSDDDEADDDQAAADEDDEEESATTGSDRTTREPSARQR